MSKMSDKHLREEVIPKLEEQETQKYPTLDPAIQERNKTVISDEDDEDLEEMDWLDPDDLEGIDIDRVPEDDEGIIS